METIIVALITGGLSLIGVIITNNASNKKVENQLMMAQAVTDTKLENLTAEVKKHNEFGTRIPLLERDIIQMKEDIKQLKGA